MPTSSDAFCLCGHPAAAHNPLGDLGSCGIRDCLCRMFVASPPYPITGTHVEPRDGDMDEVQRQIVRFAQPMFDLYDECVRVRDQHRVQLDAMAKLVDGTRLRELEAEMIRLRKQTFTATEISCLLKQAVRKRDERRAVKAPTDILDSAIRKMRADLEEAGVADPTGGK